MKCNEECVIEQLHLYQLFGNENNLTNSQTDIYSPLCLFVQLDPQVPSVQLDPKHKSIILLDTHNQA